MTTMIRPSDLNYDSYTTAQYDRDIVRSIPYHHELHAYMVSFLSTHCATDMRLNIIDLGTGTGISARAIQSVFPNAHLDLVDFSAQMLSGARAKFAHANVRFIEADYALMEWEKVYDIALSVIGLHHQTDEGKRRFFETIYSHLQPGGYFVLGDLVTYRDRGIAALNQAKHFHYLVENAVDETSLTEWAHHHMFLNKLTAVEDQVEWLQDAGFVIVDTRTWISTACVIAQKPYGAKKD